MKSELLKLLKEDCSALITDASKTALEPLRKQKILITGGTGFVGTWLAEFITFLNDSYGFGIRLLLLSERAYGFSEKAPHLAGRKDITLISQDICSFREIPDNVTYIIHAAGIPDNRIHASDPQRVVGVIVRGTEAMLLAASRLATVNKILNISSGLVYGAQPFDIPSISEDFIGALEPFTGSSAYAEAKRFAETLCGIYGTQYKLPIVNVRPFAFIGPYQLLDRPWAINNFIRDALQGGQIRILGDGETVRSYMYPSDMAYWLLKILCAGTIGLSYNVGSPEAVTLNNVANKICDNLQRKPKISSNMAHTNVPVKSKFIPNISRAQTTLNLQITVGIDAAIQRTLFWNTALLQK